MANWCSNYITIKDTKENLKTLEKHFNSAMDKNRVYADENPNWVGKLDLYRDPALKQDEITGRAFIQSIYNNDSELLIDIESAWSLVLKNVYNFVKHFNPNAKITYISEEFGCEIFQTNDENKKDDIIITMNINDYFEHHQLNHTPIIQWLASKGEDTIYSDTIYDLIDIAKYHYPSRKIDEDNIENTISKELEKLEEMYDLYDELYLNIYRYTIVPIDEYQEF